tara:strand:+ start:24973 stop:25716 length:744 start_codon:yes stop_codon:yes gene_type:complete
MSEGPTYVHIEKRGDRTPQIVIDQIKLKHKISDYLAERGVNARMRTNGNLVYHCPLPSHPNDNSPSFYIYDKGDHEDFYCYGCKSGGSIVHFVAEYENLGLRQVVERLSEGIGINVEDIMDALILEITSDSDRPSPRESLELAFCLNKSLHDYLKAVNFDPDEIVIAEKAGRMIEKYLYAENVQGLKALFDDDNPEGLGYHIRNRVNHFNCRKQEEEIERLRRNVSGGQDGRTSQEVLREHGRDKGS